MTDRVDVGEQGSALPMPKWMTNHGVTKVFVFVDMSDTSYAAKCERHFTDSGLCFNTAEQAEAWRCPRCVSEAREHERGTRDG